MLNESEQIVAELVLDGNESTEVQFNFDLERMKLCVETPGGYVVPDNLSHEEYVEWVREISFDIDHFQKLIDAPSYTLPDNLTVDEIGDWIMNLPDDEPFNFDLEKTKRAVEAPSYRVPSGLTSEELMKWMLEKAKEINDEKEVKC